VPGLGDRVPVGLGRRKALERRSPPTVNAASHVLWSRAVRVGWSLMQTIQRKGSVIRRVTGEIHDALTDTADDLDGRLPAGSGYHRAVMLVVVAIGSFLLGAAWSKRD